MNISQFLDVIIDVFYRPSQVFSRLKEKETGAGTFFVFIGLPFIIFGALGRAYTSVSAFPDSQNLFLTLFLIHIFSFSVTFFMGTWLISRVAAAFKTSATAGQTLTLIIISYIPFLTALAIASLFPDTSLISFVGLTYTILIFGKGTGILLSTPPARIIGFTMISFFILFGGNYLLNLLLELLFLPQPTI